MISVLVTGRDSQLALCLQDLEDSYSGISCKYFDSSSLNIEDITSIEEVFSKNEFHYCINCAAYTNVDKAELEPQRAIAVNTYGALNLAKVCRDYNVTLIHISTDFVFDGSKNEPYTEDDITNPLNAYGKSKRDGELEIIKNCPSHFIIRTSWLYSVYGNNFVKTILKLSQEREEINVVRDQIGNPTNANDLAEFIINIIERKSIDFGIYNYSNSGEISWYDFAQETAKIKELNLKINPIDSIDFPTKARRPKYSVLSFSKIQKQFNFESKDWKQRLKRLLIKLP